MSHLDNGTVQFNTLIARGQESIEHLREYRTALISAAVAGKIDVRDQVRRTSEVRCT